MLSSSRGLDWWNLAVRGACHLLLDPLDELDPPAAGVAGRLSRPPPRETHRSSS